LRDEVQKLKQQYTDQYVVVDAQRPELARFQNMTGQIKTFNMNGRALVQFDGDNNRGRYDIDMGFLRIVDKPPPKPAAEKVPRPAAAKPADKPEPKPNPQPPVSNG